MFQAIDKETERSLGETSIGLENILKTEKLEMLQETWLLTMPANVAKLLMTIRLRVSHVATTVRVLIGWTINLGQL